MDSAKHYYERPPQKQLIYRLLAISSTVCALGSYKYWNFKFSKCVDYFLHSIYYLVVIVILPCFLSQVVFIYLHYNEISFEYHGSIFTLIPGNALLMAKIFSAQLNGYKYLLKRFLNDIHLYNFKDQHYFVKEIAMETEFYTRYLIILFFTLMGTNCVFWVFVPVISTFRHLEEIHNKTRPYQTTVYLWMPFDYEYNFTNWIIIHAINIFNACMGCGILATSESLNYLVVLHLIGHIKVFKYKIKTKFIGKLSEEQITKNLMEIIDYHCFLLQIFKDAENAFGINITSNYLFNLINDSLLLYQLMAGANENRLIFGFMLFFFMGALILMTCIIEEIRRQTDDISEHVYNIPWENMSISNQKTVMLILARTQPTLQLKAAGGFKAGIEPTINIMKSTFSYYVMIKSSL